MPASSLINSHCEQQVPKPDVFVFLSAPIKDSQPSLNPKPTENTARRRKDLQLLTNICPVTCPTCQPTSARWMEAVWVWGRGLNPPGSVPRLQHQPVLLRVGYKAAQRGFPPPLPRDMEIYSSPHTALLPFSLFSQNLCPNPSVCHEVTHQGPAPGGAQSPQSCQGC